MLNWRRLKNAAQTTAIAATIVSSALVGTVAQAKDGAGSARKPASADDFKFPIVLCRFKQAVLKDSGGILKVVADRDWGPEYAFPVGNVHSVDLRADNGQMIHAVNGDFSGTYDIQGSSYRLRLEGAIEQGLDLAGDHQLRLRTVLEKKLAKPDSSGKLWQEVGNSSNSVIAKTQSDGTVWENVYPYTFNSSEMQRYMAAGKLKQDLVIAGIRDGLLERGSVFKVGPACGFLDGRTAKSVASAEDKLKFRAIFDKIPDAPSSESALATNSAEPKKTLSLKLPEPAAQAPVQEQVQNQASNDSGAVRDAQEEQERLAREAHERAHQEAAGGNDSSNPNAVASQPQPQGQNEMSPELQAQLAQQNQLADQAAAAYNMQSQLAQNGQAVTDGRDPASSAIPPVGMPQANTVGQVAQNIQALQSPEQVQQNMNMLEQQRAALAQQQAQIDQQQQFLAQRQQELAATSATQVDAGGQAQAQAGQIVQAGDASQVQQIQSSQAAPMGQSF